MLSFTTFQTIIQLLRMIADISILWILLYYTIKIVRNNSRTAQIFKGIILILIIRAVANFFGFKAVDFIAGILVTWGFLAIIIIFQPEIRTILERLGKSSVFSRLSTLSGNERTKLVDELVTATMQLSHNKVGALITLEQGHSLSDFIKTGTPMNSLVTSDLLMTIFLPNTPLHDGAVIIQGDRIACASAYFPPTNALVPTRYGARHRAAIGISEITDSVTIVVSEKSGRVSIAEEGKLTPMTQVELKAYLDKIILHDEAELHSAELTPQHFGDAKPEAKAPKAKSEAQPVPEIIRESQTSLDIDNPEVEGQSETGAPAAEITPAETAGSESEPGPEAKPKQVRKPSFTERVFGRKPTQPKPAPEKPAEAEKASEVSQPSDAHIKLEYSVSDESLLDDEVSDASSKGGEEQ